LSHKKVNSIVCDNCDFESEGTLRDPTRQEIRLLRDGWKAGFYRGHPVHLCSDCAIKFPSWWEEKVEGTQEDDDEWDDDDD